VERFDGTVNRSSESEAMSGKLLRYFYRSSSAIGMSGKSQIDLRQAIALFFCLRAGLKNVSVSVFRRCERQLVEW